MGKFKAVYLPDPDQRHRYIRSDRAAELVRCPHCGSEVGVPCWNVTMERWADWNTHGVRQQAARRLLAKRRE